MCLYIVDNVSTSRIIYFRYVDTEKRNNLNAIFEYRVGHFGTRDSNFSGKTQIPGSRAQPYYQLNITITLKILSACLAKNLEALVISP